jgi:predicted RNA-binding protein with RPS1 domain
MPIPEIKIYLSDKKHQANILNRHIQTLNKKIEKYQGIIDTARTALISDSTDYAKLNRLIESSEHMDAGYVSKKLLSLFPGSFGKYLVLHYGSFLDEPLNSEEKIEAFNDMINYLDSTEDFPFSKDMLDELNDIDEKELLDTLTKVDKSVYENVLSIDLDNKAELSALKEKIQEHNEMQKRNKDFYISMSSKKSEVFSEMKNRGFYKNFTDNLKIISKKYKEYTDKISLLNTALNLSYDKDGFIIS